MRRSALIRKPRVESAGISSREGPNGGYEQRLIKWGCSGCEYFEERVFRSRRSFREPDAYAICRFTGEPVDLIWEATACLKNAETESCKDQNKSDRTRRTNRRHAA